MKTKMFFLYISIIICTFMFLQNSNAQIDPEFIVGIWTLDGGEDVAIDSSENGRDGDIQNAEWDEGKFGQALSFEKGDTVVVPLGEGVITDQVSIILWLKFLVLNGQQNYFSIWDNSDNRYVPYKTSANELHFWSNSWDVASGVIVEKNTWYHVANVYDGKTVSIYVDGELKVSQAGAFSLNNNQQSSWFATDKGGWLSNCMEDDIGIFSTGLTEGQVNNIMEHGVIWALGGASVNNKSTLSTTWATIKRLTSD